MFREIGHDLEVQIIFKKILALVEWTWYTPRSVFLGASAASVRPSEAVTALRFQFARSASAGHPPETRTGYSSRDVGLMTRRVRRQGP